MEKEERVAYIEERNKRGWIVLGRVISSESTGGNDGEGRWWRMKSEQWSLSR